MTETIKVNGPDGTVTEYQVPTAEEIEAGMRVATRKMVDDQIAWAQKMAKNRRGTKHRPGATKTARSKRAAQARKRKSGAKASKRKNRGK